MQTTILLIMTRIFVGVRSIAHDAQTLGSTTVARACETLARRIVHLVPQEMIYVIMSTRYQRLLPDGGASEMSSALELAIDNHCTIFLSSSEAQDGKSMT